MNRTTPPSSPDVIPSESPRPSSGQGSTTAHMISMSDLDSRAGELETNRGTNGAGVALAESPGDLLNPLRHLRARVTVCVGVAEVTVGELLGAKEHQVLRLDRTVDQPVDVLLEGQVVARGTLVAVDDHFAVRITELPVSLEIPLVTPRKTE
jgi:flagellar motor switch protein FliN